MIRSRYLSSLPTMRNIAVLMLLALLQACGSGSGAATTENPVWCCGDGIFRLAAVVVALQRLKIPSPQHQTSVTTPGPHQQPLMCNLSN